MALTTYQSWLAAMRHPHQTWPCVKQVTSATVARWCSTWLGTGLPAAGSAPGASAVPTNATTGALGQLNPTGGKTLYGYLKRFDFGEVSGTSMSGFMIVDRLVHMSGLSGTVITAQTVSTSALTRYTSGVGVMAAFEVYTAVGATGTTITASYTNTVPTAGQTSLAVSFGGGAGASNANALGFLSLAAGDLGVTAVASVTVLASTGTAGNFGVTLFKPLAIYPALPTSPYSHRGDGVHYGSPIFPVTNGACLQAIHLGIGSATAFTDAEFGFFEA